MVTSKNELQCLASEFRAALEARLSGDRAGEYRLPSKDEVAAVCRRYLEGLFPLFHAPAESQGALVARFLEELDLMLAEQLVCAIRFDCSCRGKEIPRDVARAAENLLIEVRGKLPYLANLMATDLEAALTNDPAASGLEGSV